MRLGLRGGNYQLWVYLRYASQPQAASSLTKSEKNLWNLLA